MYGCVGMIKNTNCHIIGAAIWKEEICQSAEFRDQDILSKILSSIYWTEIPTYCSEGKLKKKLIPSLSDKIYFF
jgi:hypothetical protein